MPGCAPGSQAGITPQLPALPGDQPEEAHVPLDCQECPQPAAGGGAAPPAVLGEQLPEVDTAKLQDIPGVPGILAEQPGRDGEQDPRRASTSTPKATQNGDPAALQGDGCPQSLETLLFQDSPSKSVTRKSRTRRRSGLGATHRSHRASLAEKCSLASRRENMTRRSISRARKAAAGESSSASSRVSCESLHCFHVGVEPCGAARPCLQLPQVSCPCGLLGCSFKPGCCCSRGELGGQVELGYTGWEGAKSTIVEGRVWLGWLQAHVPLDRERLLHSLGKGLNLWHLPALQKINKAENAALKLGCNEQRSSNAFWARREETQTSCVTRGTGVMEPRLFPVSLNPLYQLFLLLLTGFGCLGFPKPLLLQANRLWWSMEALEFSFVSLESRCIQAFVITLGAKGCDGGVE